MENLRERISEKCKEKNTDDPYTYQKLFLSYYRYHRTNSESWFFFLIMKLYCNYFNIVVFQTHNFSWLCNISWMENSIKSHSPLLTVPCMLMILTNCHICHEFLTSFALYISNLIFLPLQIFSLSEWSVFHFLISLVCT